MTAEFEDSKESLITRRQQGSNPVQIHLTSILKPILKWLYMEKYAGDGILEAWQDTWC